MQNGKNPDVQILPSVENSVLRVCRIFDSRLFEESIDFVVFHKDMKNSKGGRTSIEYAIKSRISKYDFIEGVDFIRVAKNGVGTNQGFQAIEYFITLSMAKDFAEPNFRLCFKINQLLP